MAKSTTTVLIAATGWLVLPVKKTLTKSRENEKTKSEGEQIRTRVPRHWMHQYPGTYPLHEPPLPATTFSCFLLYKSIK